jgi:CIC family chloride channel protein
MFQIFSKKIADLKILTTSENSIMALLAIVVGLAGGYGAVGFRYLINYVQTLAYGSADTLLGVVTTVEWYWRILVPAIGGLVVGLLVYYFAREAKGHGVPEVMEAVALRGGVIRKRLVIVKSLASAICIGTGGSVGREGPIVQIGSAIGSSVGQIVKVSADRMRTLVGCGAAAGIAATFNAPIAGCMFALEIILGDFGLATFSPIVISSVTATAISRHYLGDFPAFIVPNYELVSAWEFPLYVTLGVLCAVVALIFVKTLYRIEDLFDDIKFPLYLKAVFGGMILGTAGLVFPHLLGVGYGAIDLSLVQELAWWLMLLLIFLKILATSITIGSGGSGGIFAPSLFLGAMTGGLFGVIVHSLFPSITASPGAYGIVGMAAIVSATTHGPLTAILTLFEMTGDYKIILPLMVTCIISSLVIQRLMKESIYTMKLIRRGVDIRQGREVNILKSIKVKDVMNPSVETVPENMGLEDFSNMVSKSKFNSFPVINTGGELSGILSFNDYNEALFNEDLKGIVVTKDIATKEVVTVTSDNNLYQALEAITLRDFSIMPVVSTVNRLKLEGVLTRRDIIGAYDKAVIKESILHSGSQTNENEERQ